MHRAQEGGRRGGDWVLVWRWDAPHERCVAVSLPLSLALSPSFASSPPPLPSSSPCVLLPTSPFPRRPSSAAPLPLAPPPLSHPLPPYLFLLSRSLSLPHPRPSSALADPRAPLNAGADFRRVEHPVVQDEPGAGPVRTEGESSKAVRRTLSLPVGSSLLEREVLTREACGRSSTWSSRCASPPSRPLPVPRRGATT